jgi:hypothetical protein
LLNEIPNKIEWRSPPLELTLKDHEESVNDIAFILDTHVLAPDSVDKSLRA